MFVHDVSMCRSFLSVIAHCEFKQLILQPFLMVIYIQNDWININSAARTFTH